MGVEISHSHVFTEPLLHEHREGCRDKAEEEAGEPKEVGVEGIAGYAEGSVDDLAVGTSGVDKSVGDHKAHELVRNLGQEVIGDFDGVEAESGENLDQKGSDYSRKQPSLMEP